MKWMNRTLLKSKFSLVLSVVLLFGFLSVASLGQTAELEDTGDSIEYSVSRQPLPSPIDNFLFLPRQVYLPDIRAFFLTRDAIELFPIATLSHAPLSPLRGPPSLSA